MSLTLILPLNIYYIHPFLKVTNCYVKHFCRYFNLEVELQWLRNLSKPGFKVLGIKIHYFFLKPFQLAFKANEFSRFYISFSKVFFWFKIIDNDFSTILEINVAGLLRLTFFSQIEWHEVTNMICQCSKNQDRVPTKWYDIKSSTLSNILSLTTLL